MKVHVVMHEHFEAPGAFELWARQRNHSILHTRLYQGDSFPSVDAFDLLIVMGGPQSPATTLQECPHFNAQNEIEFIRRALETNKLVMGVCLGAQMIGEALGARFQHSPNREIGFFPVHLTEAGKKDAIFSQFRAEFLVGHWHGDMPGLTASSQVLAYSEGCPRQIVRYSDRAYGFQCHFEFTPQTLETMMECCAHELKEYQHLPYIQQAAELRSQPTDEIQNRLFFFLDRWIL